MNIDHAICRVFLKTTLGRVKHYFPELDVRKAGVCRSSGSRTRPQYLFEVIHNGERYATYVTAENAYEARDKGWKAFMHANHIVEE